MIEENQETVRITIFCDECGEYHDTDLYNDDEAIEAAKNDGWLIRDAETALGNPEHYCPDCKDFLDNEGD